MLNIVKGHDAALITSFPVADAVVLEEGEWATLNTSGKLIKQANAYAAAQGRAFPVYGGNKVRFDAKELGVCDVLVSSAFFAETDKVAAVTINPGDALTLAAGLLTKADVATADPLSIVGYALTPNVAGKITFVRA